MSKNALIVGAGSGISAAFARQELAAGRWRDSYGDPASIPPDTPPSPVNIVDLEGGSQCERLI